MSHDELAGACSDQERLRAMAQRTRAVIVRSSPYTLHQRISLSGSIGTPSPRTTSGAHFRRTYEEAHA